MWRLAQQPSPPGANPIEFIQYGVLGLVIIALLLGWLWARPAVDHLLKDNKQLREERDKALEALIGEVHALRREVRELRDEQHG